MLITPIARLNPVLSFELPICIATAYLMSSLGWLTDISKLKGLKWHFQFSSFLILFDPKPYPKMLPPFSHLLNLLPSLITQLYSSACPGVDMLMCISINIFLPISTALTLLQTTTIISHSDYCNFLNYSPVYFLSLSNPFTV